MCAPVLPGLSRLVVLPALLLAPGYALLRLLGQATGARSICIVVPVSLVLAICASLLLDVSGIRLSPLSLGLLLGVVTALSWLGSYRRQLLAGPSAAISGNPVTAFSRPPTAAADRPARRRRENSVRRSTSGVMIVGIGPAAESAVGPGTWRRSSAVADSEHDADDFCSDEVDRLTEQGEAAPGQVAVFYRTNAHPGPFRGVYHGPAARCHRRRESGSTSAARSATCAPSAAIAYPEDEGSLRRVRGSV